MESGRGKYLNEGNGGGYRDIIRDIDIVPAMKTLELTLFTAKGLQGNTSPRAEYKQQNLLPLDTTSVQECFYGGTCGGARSGRPTTSLPP